MSDNQAAQSDGGASGGATVGPYDDGGPLVGTIWFFLMLIVAGVLLGTADYNTLYMIIGWRSLVALAGYLIMQVGLWNAEFKWDEEGSAAYLKAAGHSGEAAPEELEKIDMNGTISEEDLVAAFPVPWGFLIGWWVWGLSYLFDINGKFEINPTAYGIVCLCVCFFVSFVASVPMSDAVMHRNGPKKMKLSLAFLLGWICLGVFSGLDICKHYDDKGNDYSMAPHWFLCMAGPFTIILSQKILFASRKMGTLWEESGKPNFHPIVYNMGGPLFVLGWFMLWLGTNAMPVKTQFHAMLYPDIDKFYIPLFCNWRTMLAFFGGCGMVPIVRFLDFSHDEDGEWVNEKTKAEGTFAKWWLGTDGTYFGLFLESPWPFVIMWTIFGFSCWLDWDDEFNIGWREILVFVNCLLQGVDAGILIQQNLYAGDMEGKNKFSMPFVLLFILLAVNVGSKWYWQALILSLPGAILIILGQKTVFGARKRGDYTMQNAGKANPYQTVYVYSWGEVFFMMGWISICWGMSMP